MNTRTLKRFAQEARKTLLDQVAARLDYVLTADTPALRAKAATLEELRKAIKKDGRDAIIDQVAYTWFNRLVALRFMDVNDYQPLGLRVLSPAEGQHSPQILQEAQAGRISSELKVDSALVMDHLNGQSTASNPENEAYSLLLVAACNHLHQNLPFLFESIDDYSELLLPEDLMSHLSIVEQMRDGLEAEVCKEVEVIGWLYQFYISEKKDEVFASKSKVKAEDIPAATQLFTPRWIVEYMVQNTLGKLWLQNKPSSGLKAKMPYYIEAPSGRSKDYLKVSSVEEIKLLDQACGSGHILVYAFELFAAIYEEEGYTASEIPALVIKNNLRGMEIDGRAAQLAGFALMMKARQYHRRALRKTEAPKIRCFQDLSISGTECVNWLQKLGAHPSEALLYDLRLMQQATNLGSLIQPHSKSAELDKWLEKINSIEGQADVFGQLAYAELKVALETLKDLVEPQHCIVDNPPYMGGGNMNKELSDYVRTNYPKSKSDLMACFMEAGLNSLEPAGLLGMINQHSWMFLSSYEKLREELVKEVQFDTLLHLGPRTFPEIGGEVVQNAAFTFIKTNPTEDGTFLRLVDFDSSFEKREKTLEAIQNPDCGWFFTAQQQDFHKIPGSPIGYWVTQDEIELFAKGETISRYCHPAKGIDTGENDFFLRYWYEVEYDRIDENNSVGYWVPYNKGGEFRRWYGNRDYILRWNQNGSLLEGRQKWKKRKPTLRNRNKWFKEGFSWTTVSSGGFSARYTEHGSLFDNGGCTLFSDSDLFIYGMLLNSKIADRYFGFLSPTLNFQPGGTGSLVVHPELLNGQLDELLAKRCIEISREDWNSRETSRGFSQNALLTSEILDLENSFEYLLSQFQFKFSKLKETEETINEKIIAIYGLGGILNKEVSNKEISILQDEIIFSDDRISLNKEEICIQLISHALGCSLGRYSLDKEGLILANQGETLQDYLSKVGKTEEEVQFLPDEDNIIPFLDDEWFEDDVVGRFYEFLKVAFDEKHFAENLQFVEKCLGKDIRSYFVKDFYKDHIKRYKKRPIYWMFQSPKGHFRVLVYLHRYTPDTLNRILNSYLREFIEKLRMKEQQLLHQEQVGSTREQNQARKELAKIREMIADCREYETEILYPLATERIAIDLDDGVLVNYNKFGRAVALVPGLNDKKAKDKVRKFDWIDTTTIR